VRLAVFLTLHGTVGQLAHILVGRRNPIVHRSYPGSSPRKRDGPTANAAKTLSNTSPRSGVSY
jgi:hypothetical protein